MGLMAEGDCPNWVESETVLRNQDTDQGAYSEHTLSFVTVQRKMAFCPSFDQLNSAGVEHAGGSGCHNGISCSPG